MMTPKTFITAITLSGTLSVLSLGMTACSSISKASQDPEVAQSSPMPGMTHGSGHSMPGSSTPGMSMPGMDHGSMTLGPKDKDIDLRFIDAMIPHHEGAITMAQTALQSSSRPEIKQLAQAIIDAQEKEIAQMQGWRTTWYPNAAATPMMYDEQMGHMMPMTKPMRDSMMMNVDLGTADDQFDLRFLNAMIPHHEGALTMANEILAKSDRSEIKQLAQAILSSQQKEIDQMEQWRKDWYGQ